MHPLHPVVMHLHMHLAEQIHDFDPRTLDDRAGVVDLVREPGLLEEKLDAVDVGGEGGGGCADL